LSLVRTEPRGAGSAPPVTVRLTSESTAETRALAAWLANAAQPGDRLALVGPLGAGKTQFAKGFATGLGIEAVVNSPSFTLMAEYEGRLTLFHQDLYRLADADEVLAGGLLDERQDDGVTLSEWADRLDEGLDPGRVTVAIEPTGEERRELAITGHGPAAERYLAAARAWAERPA
jgi:tRNA threonylcarbamoyladenosine biosynthesis protein TsaE